MNWDTDRIKVWLCLVLMFMMAFAMLLFTENLIK